MNVHPKLENRFAADDWGLCPTINEAILKLAERKLLHSVSILGNGVHLETGLDLLLQLQTKNRFKLALHFNLTEGLPVSGSEQVPSLLNSNHHFPGQFEFWRRLMMRQIAPHELTLEMRHQQSRLEENEIEIDEVNGHHHIHNFKTVFTSIVQCTSGQIEEYRVMDDPSHMPSYIAGRRFKRYVKNQFGTLKTAPLIYLQPASFSSNLAKIVGTESPVLIHPAIPTSPTDTKNLSKMTKRRIHDFNFVWLIANELN